MSRCPKHLRIESRVLRMEKQGILEELFRTRKGFWLSMLKVFFLSEKFSLPRSKPVFSSCNCKGDAPCLHVSWRLLYNAGISVQFISRESSQVTNSLVFLSWNSIYTRTSNFFLTQSRLETRYSKLSRIENQDSRIEGQGTVNLLFSHTVSTVCCGLNLFFDWFF